LTGTKPDGNPISAVLYFELGADGKLLWAQKDTPKALAKTGADSWATMGMLLGALAMVGFGARLAFSGRRKA
jgi:LPXTG-motif cell wall-anchored protein